MINIKLSHHSMKSKLIALSIIGSLFCKAQESETSKLETLEDFEIIGKNESLSTLTLGIEDLRKGSDAVNPLDSLNRVPSVYFGGADQQGFYEYGQNFNLRIFTKTQIAVTVDGVPLNNQSPAGGTPVGRFIDNETLQSVTVNQGSGDISTASNFGLGGRIDFITGAPKQMQDLEVSYLVGSDNLSRAFVRADTGTILGGGTAYVSFSDTSFDKWRSAGDQLRKHLEAKYLHPLDNGSIGANFYWNDRDDHDFLNVTYAEFQQFGRMKGLNTTWYHFDTDKAKQVSLNEYYFDTWTNRRDDWLLSFPFLLDVSDSLTLSATPYFSENEGVGTWSPPQVYTTFNADGSLNTGGASDNTQSSWRETQYALERAGFTADAEWETESFLIKLGMWYEKYQRDHRREWFQFADTVGFDKGSVSSYGVQFDRLYEIDTMMLYGSVDYALSENLSASVGARWHEMEFEASDKFNAANKITGEDKDSFLPHVGLVYNLSDTNQVYASFSENFSQRPDSAIMQTAPVVEPEHSYNYDFGYRSAQENLYYNANLFLIDYKDVIESYNPGNIYGNESVFENIGGISSWGIELASGLELSEGLDIFGSLTWNNSEYDKDIVEAGPDGNLNTADDTVAAISGKNVVMIPEFSYFLEVTYGTGGYLLGLNNRFIGERETNRLNQGEVLESVNLMGAFAKYSKEVDENSAFTVSFNVLNMLDEEYLATTSDLGSGASNTAGSASFAPGAPRTYSLQFSYDF